MTLSENENFALQTDLTKLISSFSTKRAGEIRLGEIINGNWKNSHSKYVLLGISESIGPQANYGRPGAEKTFDAFLSSFCNLQWNETIHKESITYLGKISSIKSFTTINEAKERVSELDEFVYGILSPIIESGKIPIVIGGGHNNALPLIHSLATHFKKVTVVNMDAHADCRALEGRHSGNSFSYAFEKQLLSKYAVFGLHKAYLNQSMIEYLKANSIQFEYFDNYILGNKDFKNDIQAFIQSIESDEKLGIELDLDSISNFPSSAMNPIGFSISDARNFLFQCNKHSNIGYYHLTEAAVNLPGDERIVGKVLAQLTYDILSDFKY